MSTTDIGGAARPLLVVDAYELRRHLQEMLSPPADDGRAYTEQFGWKKTDIALGPAGAVNASRLVLAGDVREIGGWSLTDLNNVGGSSVRWRDGSSSAAEQAGRITLAQNGSSFVWPQAKGVEIFTGRIFLEVVSGSVEGVVFWR